MNISHISDIKVLNNVIRNNGLDSLDFLHEVLSNTDNGINILDRDFNILYSNGKLVNFEEIKTDSKCYELIGNSIKICDDCYLLEVFRSGEKKQIKKRQLLTNKHCEVTLIPIKDGNGETIFVLQRIKDITNDESVKQKLIDALQMANAGNRAKEEFVANMSHELRTPLNGIIGSLQFLTDLDKESKDFVQMAISSARQLSTVLSNVLLFKDISTGQLKYNETKINFHHFLNRIVEETKNQISFRSMEFSLKCGSNLPELILVDESFLYTCMTQVIGNAIKFTKQGKIKLTVDTKKIDDMNNLIFIIEDSGVGIDDDNKSRVFYSFTQGEHYLKKNFGGIGLGLTITKHLIEKMNGTINIDSEKGNGTKVVITLPYTSVVGEIEKWENQVEKLKGKHVLVVEDEAVNMAVICKILTKYGCIIDKAPNGQVAVELDLSNRYDMILMDIQMPVMDGLKSTEQIRQLEGFTKERVPIVAVTAHTGNNIVDDTKRAGMDDIVYKPIDTTNLISTMLKYF